MAHDIDWETACNDFHPAFALVRGERFEPEAKPFPPVREPVKRVSRQRTLTRPLIILVPELLP